MLSNIYYLVPDENFEWILYFITSLHQFPATCQHDWSLLPWNIFSSYFSRYYVLLGFFNLSVQTLCLSVNCSFVLQLKCWYTQCFFLSSPSLSDKTHTLGKTLCTQKNNNSNKTFLSIDSKICISSLDLFPSDSYIQLNLLSISNETYTNLSIIFFLLNLFYVCLPISVEGSDIFLWAQVKTLATFLYSSYSLHILNCHCISKLFSHCHLKNWTEHGMNLHCILSEMPQWPLDSS